MMAKYVIQMDGKWMEIDYTEVVSGHGENTRFDRFDLSAVLVYLGIWPIELRYFPTKTFAAAGISQPCLMMPESSTRHADHAEHLFADCRA